MATYRDTPAYQRLIQRQGRIRPEQRAILDTLSVDKDFATEETRRVLQSLRFESDKAYRDKLLGLRERTFDVGIGLRGERFGRAQKQERLATTIGLGEVAAATGFGIERDKIDREILKRKMDFLNRFGA